MMTETCTAYSQGNTVCRNGFPQSGACLGNVCHFCGKPGDSVPACVGDNPSDKWFAAWMDESGRPKLAQVIAKESGAMGDDLKGVEHG